MAKQITLHDIFNVPHELINQLGETICCNSSHLHQKFESLYDRIIKLVSLPFINTKSDSKEIFYKLFYSTSLLYFIYELLDYKYKCYQDKIKELRKTITNLMKNPLFKKRDESYQNDSTSNDDSINKFDYNIQQYILRYFYIEDNDSPLIKALMNFCVYYENHEKFYKKLNEAIIFNNNLTLWLDTLKFAAFTHTSNYDEETNSYSPDFSQEIQELNIAERSTISLAEKIYNVKGSFSLQPGYHYEDFTQDNDSFQQGLYLSEKFLKKWPCLLYLLYNFIPTISYNKFKLYFIENENPPQPFNGAENYTIYNLEEFTKISFTQFKGEWGHNRAQLLFFFAIRDLATNKTAFDKVIKSGEWHCPQKQKDLLNLILNENSIPNISKELDFNVIHNFIKDSTNNNFTTTETCINLIYNIAHYKKFNSPADITQQINFIDEQRDHLFTSPKIKPSDLEHKDRKENAENPKYFNQFCQQSRDRLIKEIDVIKSIDCGFKMQRYTQKYPSYNKEFFSRDLGCKLFLETDTACNLPKEEFYKKRYNDLLSNRYIYPERNNFTHYSKYTPTESLLDEQNFGDLLICLHGVMTRLQQEQELRNIADRIDTGIRLTNSSSFETFNYSYDDLISKLKKIIHSPDYTGTLKDQDIKKIESFDTSKQYLEILEKIKKNIPELSTNYDYLKNVISFYKEFHPNLYCLLKDILCSKEYSGNLTLSLLEEIKNKSILSPLFRSDKIYFTLCDVKKDYPVENNLSKELDNYIDNYRNYTTIIPHEDSKQLVDLFSKVESFILSNWNSLTEKLNTAISSSDSKILKAVLHIIYYYDNPQQICTFLNDKSFSDDYIQKYKSSLDNIKEFVKKKYLTEKIKEALAKDDYDFIMAVIRELRSALYNFCIVTDIVYNDGTRDFIEQEILYDTKEILAKINQAKYILKNFGQSDDQLKIFNTDEMQQFIKGRQYNDFSARKEQITQHINNSILFHYKIEHPINFSAYADCNESRKQNLNEIKIFIEECIHKQNYDELLKTLKHIEYFEIRDIQLNKKTPDFEVDFLNNIRKLTDSCQSLNNDKIKELAQIISNRISQKQQQAAFEYDENSTDVFEKENTYDSYLIKACHYYLIEAIKYCTHSKQVKQELKKNIIINKEGRLGIPYNKEFSQTFKYPEPFKKEIRILLNSLFGVDHICTLKKNTNELNLDTIGERDVDETDVSFFDLYGNQIMLYLTKVTLEFAQVKKIEI